MKDFIKVDKFIVMCYILIMNETIQKFIEHQGMDLAKINRLDEAQLQSASNINGVFEIIEYPKGIMK